MSVINATPLLAAAGGDYQISRSVRLRSSASAYFNRTPASTGNRRTWTWSGWVKRGSLSVPSNILFFVKGSNTDATYLRFGFDFQVTGCFSLTSYNNTTIGLTTTQVFRDPSAWYHIVVAFDTTQVTASNRVKIYVNGAQVTSFSTANYPALNTDYGINNNVEHDLGAAIESTNYYFDGYLTEVNFIDGQALTPSSFGETDSITGVWKPKKYAGTYGTNGFYLNFSDNSSNTATTIGKDNSGNGNNWTPNNISVTSGATYDSMLDVPTLYADGGNGRGNYAVLNPLQSRSAPSRANLEFIQPNAGHGPTVGTIGMTTGKWYWEVDVTTFSSGTSSIHIGIVGDNYPFASGNYIGNTATSYAYRHSGQKYNNAASSAYGGVYGAGNVIGVALDLDAGTLTFYLNNVSQGTAYSGLSGTFYPGISVEQSGSTSTVQANFGQRPFAYTPPTGFKALNTQNLPEPTIKKGNQYFDVSTWTGDNASPRSITGLGFQPDLVWAKARSVAYSHSVFDSVRGTGKRLITNATNAENTNDASGYVSAFNADGFTMTAGSSDIANINESTRTYVGWQWKESASAGFDIVTYTGTGSATTVAHSLGVAPKLMFIKARSLAGSGWTTYSSVLGAGQFLSLNTTAAATSSIYPFNNTAPTSSVFSVGPTGNGTNNSGVTYVAYLFAEVAGFSKFGSYTGNGSTDGAFVYTGFRPKFILVKRTDSSTYGNWEMIDTARDTYNQAYLDLSANLSAAENATDGAAWDILSNGFKCRDGSSTGNKNVSGATYIYAAFAEHPFRNSLAR